MKPFYQESGIQIYHGDCREILPVVSSGAGVLLTDPPYGLGYDASHEKYKNGVNRGTAGWDSEAFSPHHLVELGLPSIIWGANCFASRLPDYPGWLCWVKTARNDADIRQADMELAWTNFIRRPRTFRHLWVGAYRASESGLRNWHPTQKPEALMKWCIGLMPNGIVLDPYMGSGTTLRAAKDLGRGAIGIEVEERYCEIAARRLRQEVFSFEPVTKGGGL